MASGTRLFFKSIQGILVHVLSYRAKGAFLMSSFPNLKLSDQKHINTVHAVLISFSLVYCIFKSFKNEIHFSNFDIMHEHKTNS